MTSIINWITSPLASFKKWYAGPRPDLNPNAILADIEKDPFMNTIAFKLGQGSVHSNSIGSNYEQVDSIQAIQRGLIAIGLININRNADYWWSSSNFKWGNYGPATISAVNSLQKAAKIADNRNGKVFGPETLDALKKALTAKAEGKDWKTAIQSSPKTATK